MRITNTARYICHLQVLVGIVIPVYPWFLIKEMESREKFGYTRLLRTARELNDEMIEYWAKRISVECLKMDMPLSEVKICIGGITSEKELKSYITAEILL